MLGSSITFTCLAFVLDIYRVRATAQTVNGDGYSHPIDLKHWRSDGHVDAMGPQSQLRALATFFLGFNSALAFNPGLPGRDKLHSRSQRCRHAATMMSGEEAEAQEGEDNTNVVGTKLRCCCADVHGSGIGTGIYRDGFCSTCPGDQGRHTVCIKATEDFLAVSAAVGNPLHQVLPQYNFPGVRPGDRWCLCAPRFAQLLQLLDQKAVRSKDGEVQTNFVPQIYLLATHQRTLEHVTLEKLMEYAIDKEEAKEEMERLEAMRSALQNSLK
mmetsp:Transcript_97971/g.179036  ORF Transcript_97971/g.179036 Transcript_97971/m.179036 type:complete len:270 (+) Transcript_97971:65-874(+)